jgi:hypothetical protein
MGRGVVLLPFLAAVPGIDWGGAGLATLHSGFDFGTSAKFDVFVGLGAGVFGNYWTPFSIGIAESSGVCWFLSDKLTLIAESVYMNGFGLAYSWLSYVGVGVQLKL